METIKQKLISEISKISKDQEYQKNDLLNLIKNAETLKDLEKLSAVIEILK